MKKSNFIFTFLALTSFLYTCTQAETYNPKSNADTSPDAAVVLEILAGGHQAEPKDTPTTPSNRRTIDLLFLLMRITSPF